MTAMTIASDSTPESSVRLKRELKAAEAKKRAMALLLIAPLAIFLLLIFVVPIGALLTRAAQNPEVVNALPHTLSALRGWDRKTPPPDAAYAALAVDLTAVADTHPQLTMDDGCDLVTLLHRDRPAKFCWAGVFKVRCSVGSSNLPVSRSRLPSARMPRAERLRT